MPLSFAPPTRALVRPPPTTFPRCLRHTPATPDLARAHRQHAAYVRALTDAGVTVSALPPCDDLPDSCFVEDPALVLGPQRALLSRSAAPSRAPEAAALAPALAAWCALDTLPAPGTLDGGDVLRVHDRLYVGRSARTSDQGIDSLRQVAAAAGLETVAVPLRDGLHLKSAVTLAAPDLLLYHPALLASAQLHYVHAKAGIDAWFDRVLLAPLTEGTPAELWAGAHVACR